MCCILGMPLSHGGSSALQNKQQKEHEADMAAMQRRAAEWCSSEVAREANLTRQKL